MANVRRLMPNDAEAFRHLRLEALQIEPSAFGESVAEAADRSVEEVAERLRDANDVVLGAFIDDALVGMAGFARSRAIKRRHTATVWGVYVTPPARRRGVGRQLLAELIAQARAMPELTVLTLSVTVEQAAALALYTSMGFTAYGRQPSALRVGTRLIDEDLLVLRLT